VQLLAETDPKCPLCREDLPDGQLSAYNVNYSLRDILPLVQQAKQAENNEANASHEMGQEAFRVGPEQLERGPLLGSGGQGHVYAGMFLRLDRLWISWVVMSSKGGAFTA
jgi:hypothetical protein